ncbi:hypothetical protein NUSPORA_00676 [Nucleospora cyclopteri]
MNQRESYKSNYRMKTWNGKIKLKVPQPNYQEQEKSIKLFLEEYFNNLYHEMSIFGNYFSVQEFTNRAKISEFCKKKLPDFDKLYLILKCFILYTDVKTANKIKNDYHTFHQNVVGMADYLYTIYQNMKTSFTTSYDVNSALQSFFYNCINLNREEEKNIENYEEINRFIRILLLKENITSSYVRVEIKKGLLHIFSDSLKFKLNLTGKIENPKWVVFKVHTNNNQIDQSLKQLFDNIKENLIFKIVEFIDIHETKNKAKMIYEKLENVQGKLQSFSGYFQGVEIVGKIIDKRSFSLYKISENNKILIDDLEGISKLAERNIELENSLQKINLIKSQRKKIKFLYNNYRIAFYMDKNDLFINGNLYKLIKYSNKYCVISNNPDQSNITVDFETIFYLLQKNKDLIILIAKLPYFTLILDENRLKVDNFYVYYDRTGYKITENNEIRLQNISYKDILFKIDLFNLQNNDFTYGIVQNSLQFVSLDFIEPDLGVIKINSSIITENKQLNRDLVKFNLEEGFEYIKRYKHFYIEEIFPTGSFIDMIILKGNISICYKEKDLYEIFYPNQIVLASAKDTDFYKAFKRILDKAQFDQ